MPQGYYTIEQWTAGADGAPGRWSAVLQLPFGASLSAAESALEKLGNAGFYRIVQMQRDLGGEAGRRAEAAEIACRVRGRAGPHAADVRAVRRGLSSGGSARGAAEGRGEEEGALKGFDRLPDRISISSGDWVTIQYRMPLRPADKPARGNDKSRRD
jgi:hypothetical protein